MCRQNGENGTAAPAVEIPNTLHFTPRLTFANCRLRCRKSTFDPRVGMQPWLSSTEKPLGVAVPRV
jgi:hypothetical protein